MGRALPNDCEFFAEFTKVDDEKRLVFGYASTDTRDRQGEIVKREAIEAALPDYMRWGNVREMHQPSAVGKAHEAEMDPKGLWFGAFVADDRAWRKVKTGIYKGFSIGGRVVARDPNDKSVITKVDITEISLVDRPANPDARFEFFKRADDLLQFQPTQVWHCGCGEHQHLTKSEAAECMADRANDLHKLLEAGALLKFEGDVEKRDFSDKQREHAAGSGAALPDGSFPIENKGDLRNAIHAVGRAKDYDRAKAHIITRAKSLGAESMLPEEWSKWLGEGDDITKAVVTPPRQIQGGQFAGHLKSADEAGKLAAENQKLSDACHGRCRKHELLAQESAKAGNSAGAAAHRALAKSHKAMAMTYEKIADKYTRLAAKHGDWAQKAADAPDHGDDAVAQAKRALATLRASSKRAA